MTDYQKTWRRWIGGIASTPILDPFGELPALFVSPFASMETNPSTDLVLIAAVVLLPLLSSCIRRRRRAYERKHRESRGATLPEMMPEASFPVPIVYPLPRLIRS